MKWTNKGHEFDELSNVIIEAVTNKKFYIWGAGYFGDIFFEHLSDEVNIIGYIDSNIKKHSEKMNGLLIYPPSILKDVDRNAVIVLVSAGWTKDIFTNLLEMGFQKNVHCFHIDEFLSIYMMYKKDKLYLTSLTLTITEKCTLRCKNCNAFVPYYVKPQNISLNDFRKEIETIFKTVDYVVSLMVCGGDAMCNPECAAIIKFIMDNYLKSKVGTIEVFTNAVIIPDEKFLELLRKSNAYFRFTDYGVRTQRIEEIIKLLNMHNIRYDHVKFTHWNDSGYPQESNGLFDDVALQEFFNRCDRRSCQGVSNGRFFYCGMAIAADRIGYCKILEDDYFDLCISKINKKELLEFALGYSVKGYLNYCRKCNGSFNVNKKIIPSGEQL